MRSRCWLVLLPFLCSTVSQGQSNAPDVQTNPPPFRSESTVVLVPTLVRTKSGEVVHGLTADDFIVEDNGVDQSVRLDNSVDIEPLSVVVTVEIGRDAVLILPTAGTGKTPSAEAPLSGLGTMLKAFVGQDEADVAVVSFDSHVHLVQGFSEDIPSVADKLDKLAPGDDGAAILDAVSYSVELFNHQATNGRRVLLLISETRDQGSHIARIANIVQEVGLSNTIVYSLAFSPARAEFMHDLHEQPARNTYPNLLAPLMIGANSVRKNSAMTIARLAGGEYATFTNARSFDEHIETFAGDDRDRYVLAFQPQSPKPGPHTITVRLRNRQPGYTVTARSMYWSVARGAQR
jgi:VWFA-related protein